MPRNFADSPLYMPLRPWSFYIIANGGRTYAGVSPDPVRRLRQHNGEISGGAKYTTSTGPGWYHICLVEGFITSRQALQFEWAVKHERPRGKGGLVMRLEKLHRVLARERWTSNAPLASTVPLSLKWVVDTPCVRPLPPYVAVQFVSGPSFCNSLPSQVKPDDGGGAIDDCARVGQGLLGSMVDSEVGPDSAPDDCPEHEKERGMHVD
mgnify:CR=1 FL=1